MATTAHSVPAPSPAILRIGLQSIEAGIDIETLTQFLNSSGLTFKDIYDVVIPARTLKHRRALRQNLSRDESDKLARVIRLYEKTLLTFGNSDKALRWLRKPKERFEGRTPLQTMRTDLGGRMVEEMLVQIDEGMFV